MRQIMWATTILMIWGGLLLCKTTQAAEHAPTSEHIIALISTSPNDESAANPVFTIDVEFQAFLSLAIKNGPSWIEKSVNEEVRIKALRTVVLTRFLARAARQIGSNTSTNDASDMMKWITKRIGDRHAMDHLFKITGGTVQDLERWVGDSLLAREQIIYIGERLNLSSEAELNASFAAGGHPFVGSSLESVRLEYKRYYNKLLTQQKIEKLIADAFETGRVRFVKCNTP